MWFSREEVESFLQTKYQPGQEIDIPADLANRIACLSLLDKGMVDGFTKPFRKGDIEMASITMKVTDLSDTEVQFQILGSTSTKTADAQGFVTNMPKYDEIPRYRGVKTKILGSATLGIQSNKFVKFQMIAAGTRFGGAYIGRKPEDWGEHPIGFSFVMGESVPAEQIAPEFPYRYPWVNQNASSVSKGKSRFADSTSPTKSKLMAGEDPAGHYEEKLNVELNFDPAKNDPRRLERRVQNSTVDCHRAVPGAPMSKHSSRFIASLSENESIRN